MNINISRVDLNLLIVFDALMAERHLSRAAARIGRSQPAMSHALRRLRHLFNDPLLVRGKGGMKPTARALELEEPVRTVLSEIAALTGQGADFDPGTARRTFRLAMSDYNARILLPALARRVRAEAPDVNLIVHQGGRRDTAEALAQGAVDLVVTSLEGVPKGMRGELLLRDRVVCVASKKAMGGKRALTLAEYLDRPHLNISLQGDAAAGPIDDILAKQGLRRRNVITLAHFLVIPAVLSTTDIVATLASRIARAYSAEYGLVVFKPPFEVHESMIWSIWHPRAEADPGHRWLRELLYAVAADRPGDS
jgi:DNA-binding transcriptional LysR family regulator